MIKHTNTHTYIIIYVYNYIYNHIYIKSSIRLIVHSIPGSIAGGYTARGAHNLALNMSIVGCGPGDCHSSGPDSDLDAKN